MLTLLVIQLVTRLNFLTGDLGGMIPVYEIPSEYAQLKGFLLDSGKNNVRIISFPKTDYEAYGWNKNSNYKDFPQVYNFLEFYLHGAIMHSRYGNHTLRTNPFYKKIFDPNYCYKSKEFVESLYKIDVDYVILQKDLINRKGSTVKFDEYKECLTEPNFVNIFNNEYFDFYWVNYGSQYTRDYEIKEVYPFYYTIDLHFEDSEDVELKFPQNYNAGWKLYLDGAYFPHNYLLNKLIPFYSDEIKVQNADNEPGNRWVLERSKFSGNEVRLHLYYYPQIYVVIGFVITIMTLFFVLFIGVLIIMKNKMKKRNSKK